MRKKNLGWRAGSASNSHTGSEFKSLATKQKATTGLLCIYNPSTVRHKNRETTGICRLTAQLQVKWETLPQRNTVAGDQRGHLMFSSGLHAHTWNSLCTHNVHMCISQAHRKNGHAFSVRGMGDLSWSCWGRELSLHMAFIFQSFYFKLWKSHMHSLESMLL